MKVQGQMQRGQMMLVLALSAVALIGAIAPSTDIGLRHYHTEMLPRAADSRQSNIWGVAGGAAEVTIAAGEWPGGQRQEVT